MWQDKPAKGGVEGRKFLPRQIVVRKDEDGELVFAEDGDGLTYHVTVSPQLWDELKNSLSSYRSRKRQKRHHICCLMSRVSHDADVADI